MQKAPIKTRHNIRLMTRGTCDTPPSRMSTRTTWRGRPNRRCPAPLPPPPSSLAHLTVSMYPYPTSPCLPFPTSRVTVRSSPPPPPPNLILRFNPIPPSHLLRWCRAHRGALRQHQHNDVRKTARQTRRTTLLPLTTA